MREGLTDSIRDFLKSEEGQMLLVGIGASVFLDSCELRVLNESQEKFYNCILDIMNEFAKTEDDLNSKGRKEAAAAIKRELIDCCEGRNPESLQERNFINFTNSLELVIDAIPEQITQASPINYKIFAEIEKSFMKPIISEVIIMIFEAVAGNIQEDYLRKLTDGSILNKLN